MKMKALWLESMDEHQTMVLLLLMVVSSTILKHVALQKYILFHG